MNLPLFQIDAFTNKVFGGNPAAVIPLDKWLADETMQQIALENNLSETVFLVKSAEDNTFEIRWFTPKVEVDLCGHATIAASYYLFEIAGFMNQVFFDSKSGRLSVTKENDWYYLDFPSMALDEVELPKELAIGVGGKPTAAFKSKDDWQLLYETQEEIEALTPNFNSLKNFPARGIIATSVSAEDGIDFVSRFFAPAAGVDEDPVTGSAHTKLIPFWSAKLNKNELTAKQLSFRTGLLQCKHQNDRVSIGGQAVLYLVGNIYI